MENEPIENLELMLRDHFDESEIIPSDWDDGFEIKPKEDNYTWLTVYFATGTNPPRYSLYIAIPDRMRGIDIEDEKPVIERALIGHIRDAIIKLKEEIEKPLVCVLLKSGDKADLEENRLKLKKALDENGIANFISAGKAAKALARLSEYRDYLHQAGGGTS